MKKMMMIAGFGMLLAGCGTPDGEVRVSGAQETEDSRKVEDVLRNEDRISSAVAVFVKEDLLVGVEVKPLSRWNKAKIEKELMDEMEKSFPDETVTLSTDLKIYWETDKLDEIDEEGKLHDKVETIKSLSKEET